jgi:hypothetical protein
VYPLHFFAASLALKDVTLNGRGNIVGGIEVRDKLRFLCSERAEPRICMIHLHCIFRITSNLDAVQAIVVIASPPGFREVWMEGKAVGNKQGRQGCSEGVRRFLQVWAARPRLSVFGGL